MTIRKIEPNNIILIKDVISEDNKTKVVFINEIGVQKEANLVIEDLKNKKMIPVALKDWNSFMGMLGETAVTAAKLKDLELQFGKIIDEKVTSITARFATEPENIATLAAELGQLTANKANTIAEMVIEEVEKLKEEARSRKNFVVGGIMRFENENGISRALEIPQEAKKARNMKTLSNYNPTLNYSFTLDGKPLKVSDLENIDMSKVKIKNTLAATNINSVIENVFAINNNTINGLTGNKGEVLFTKLLNIYGQSDAAKELYSFKKDLKIDLLTMDEVDKLRELYANVKEDVLKNGLVGYTIDINVYYSPKEKQRVLERMVDGITDGVMKKLTGETKLPADVELTNIVGIHKIPTNVVKGVEMADQWYGAITTSNKEEISNITAPITGKTDEFISSTIENQIRAIALKEQELENKINDMDK